MFSKTNKPGFTLVELMISIAIVLILMVGINFVFTTSAKTISTGMALSSVGRDIGSARKTFEADLSVENVVSPDQMPAILIQNEEINAFRDKQDRLADYDYDPTAPWATRQIETGTYDADGNASNGDEVNIASFPGTYNFRRHRIDRLSLFVSNQAADYTPQTGDASTFVGATTSSEAWLWYGMLRLATNDDLKYAKPGVGTEQTNPNNFYASQWMLGRKLTLLKAAPYSVPTTAMGNNLAASAAANLAYASVAYSYAANALPAAATAFNRETTANGGPYLTSTQWQMPESRVDVANASIATVRSSILTAGVVSSDADYSATNAFDIVDYTSVPTFPNSLNYIFWAKPFVNKQSFTNATNGLSAQTREAALTSPIFLRGCMQFIVEFAGDFYDQGPISGNPEPAGTIDYVTLPTGGTQTRWYGISRHTSNKATLSTAIGSPDVNPMSVLPSAGAVPRWAGVSAEHAVSGQPTYWVWGPTDKTILTSANNFRPKLIRITLELIDSNGRLQDGQRIEFVYKLN